MKDRQFSSHEQLTQQSFIKQKIEAASRQHPDAVVIYFVKHKAAPQQLSKPKNPLMMFKRSTRIQEVFYALYQQIQVRGLAFYVIKTLDQNKSMYHLLQAGKTVGQVYDQFKYNNYLTIIYKKGGLNRWNLSPQTLRIIRLLIIIALVVLVYNVIPHFQTYFGTTSQTFKTNAVDQN